SSDVDAVRDQPRREVRVGPRAGLVAALDLSLDGGEVGVEALDQRTRGGEAPELVAAVVAEAIEAVAGDLVVLELVDADGEGGQGGGDPGGVDDLVLVRRGAVGGAGEGGDVGEVVGLGEVDGGVPGAGDEEERGEEV